MIIFIEYVDFTNVFLKKLAKKLLKWRSINKHVIDRKNNKQLLYKPIDSLEPLELKILKIYIKTHLANSCYPFFKTPTGVSILFVQRAYNSFLLMINYWRNNNFIIKNQYLLLPMGMFFQTIRINQVVYSIRFY